MKKAISLGIFLLTVIVFIFALILCVIEKSKCS